MYIIDFHSHILPGIDDGARNLETSMAMLEQVQTQGIDIMAATPHFYASRDRIDTFIARREDARDVFLREIEKREMPQVPKFLFGSEVAFFDGISRADEISKLTIQGTNLLLLEMPFVPWTDQNLREVEKLIKERKLHIIIAHLERFLWIPGNKKMAERLLQMPVTIQLNAESMLEWKRRRTLLKMLKDGSAHVLGSDCHGAHHRVPNLAEGRAVIQKKMGASLLEEIDRRGSELLQNALDGTITI